MVDPVAVVRAELGIAEATVVDRYTENSGLKDGVYRVQTPDRDVVSIEILFDCLEVRSERARSLTVSRHRVSVRYLND